MLSETVKSIFPFVPAKTLKSQHDSTKDLGFSCPSDDEDVWTFIFGQFVFLLQDFYVEEWANNFMMNLHVDDALLQRAHSQRDSQSRRSR